MLPEAKELARWLFQGPPRLPSGAYLSWVSEDHTGFPYPEAAAVTVRTALWLHRTHKGAVDPLRLLPTLHFLSDSRNGDGIVTSRGPGYLFDTALVAAALNEAARDGIPGRYGLAVPPMLDACAALLKERRAISAPAPERWSTVFGPHLLKALALLRRFNEVPPALWEITSAAIPSLAQQQKPDGAFATSPDGACYLHAHCYALEGLAMLSEQGFSGLEEPFARGMKFLKREQRPNGSFPRWAGETEETACDVTAQAGRLFLLPTKHSNRETAARAAGALDTCRGPGGMHYLAGLKHQNTWCTAFTLQFRQGLSTGLAASELV